MTQCETVMKHMRERGGITTKEAYERYGITRLGARIYELKALGVEIVTEMVDARNRYGEKVRVARYRLK